MAFKYKITETQKVVLKVPEVLGLVPGKPCGVLPLLGVCGTDRHQRNGAGVLASTPLPHQLLVAGAASPSRCPSQSRGASQPSLGAQTWWFQGACALQEGKAASLAADFSITQFKHIGRLLVVHGRSSYKRSAALGQFVMHRGLVISTMQVCGGREHRTAGSGGACE